MVMAPTVGILTYHQHKAFLMSSSFFYRIRKIDVIAVSLQLIQKTGTSLALRNKLTSNTAYSSSTNLLAGCYRPTIFEYKDISRALLHIVCLLFSTQSTMWERI